VRQKSLFKKIYDAIELIPEGKVATYGQIGKYVGCSAKYVGYALSSLKNDNIPWHRVINSKGKISIKDLEGYNLQKHLLELEGIIFDKDNSVDLEKYLYKFDNTEWDF
jgi:methylated-DNA-protein-cysteine methyltransferase-like protein